MPALTITDFVLTGAGKAGVYVQLRDNATGLVFTSAAASDSNGQFSIGASAPPPADYSLYTSPSLSSPNWTLYDPHYRIGYTKGDDISLNSVTAGGPVMATTGAPALPGTGGVGQVPLAPTPLGVVTGQVWDFGGSVYHPKAFGAKGDGITDDTVALKAWGQAIKGNALGLPAGVGETGAGNYVYSSLLDFSSTGLYGSGPFQARGAGRSRSIFTYTGGNIAVAFDMSNIYSKLYDLQMTYTSNLFAGTLVAARGITTGQIVYSSVVFYGNGNFTAQYLLDITYTSTISIWDSQFNGGQYSILGTKTDGTQQSKGVYIAATYFNGCAIAHIRNVGQGWDVSATSEPTTGGKGQFIVMDAACTAQGVDLHGLWLGDDVTDNTAWSWIQVRGQGWKVSGSFIAGTGVAAATAIQVMSATSGLVVIGNQLKNLAVGVALGANLATNVWIGGNDAFNTVNLWTGTPNGQALIQSPTGGAFALDVWGAPGVRAVSFDPNGNQVNNGNVQGALLKAAVQVYPGAEAAGIQTIGGILHSTGVPSNANGNNNDWCISDNHHLYTRSGGVWVDLTAAVNSMSTPANPALTASLVGVMMGLAGAITPIRTGTVLITISGDMFNSVINDGVTAQIRTGTGAAPGNGTALAGTARGNPVADSEAVAATKTPFAITVVASGLALGVAVWIDLGVAAVTGGNASVENITITAVEV